MCDNGSQVNLISRKAIEKLGIKINKTETAFIGIDGCSLGSSLGSVQLKIILPKTGEILSEQFHIMEKITNYSLPKGKKKFQPNSQNWIWLIPIITSLEKSICY